MSTSGTEKHCRLCLMLSKGGTKACHNLLLKRVDELKPKDFQPNAWTLKTFLESKKQIIIKSKLSKEKWKVLFPKTGDTVLSNWDLSLFCQVLSSYCGLTGIDLLDIKQLRTIRNDLCHMNDAEITNTEFKNKIEMIQVIIGRILEKLDDKDLKLEVDNIIKNLESEPLSLGETLKEMRKFYLMEMEVREKLDHVEEILLEKFEKLDDKCELINNKLDQRGSSGIDSARNNVLVPGVNIFLDLKNVSNDEEAHMSDVLQQLFEEVMNQDNDFKSSIPLNSYGRLRAAVNKTFQLFLSKGWRIISAVHECIQLHIRCSNFKSLAALFREHINGQINTNLSDLNEALTELVSGGKPCFQTTIYRDEFWNVLDKSISSVDRFLSELNIDNVQPLNEGRRFTLSFSARNAKSERSESFYEDCNNELHTCLQLLKTELESEFSTPHLSIQASCSTNVNREKDDTFTDDEVENLNGQGDIMKPIKTGDVKISKLCKEEKKISYMVKEDEEKCHNTAIMRLLEDIDSTKETQEKEKYNNEKKKKITEHGDLHDQTIFSPASTSTYSKEDRTDSISKYCTAGKEITYRIKDGEEKEYKTAIKRPFVKDIHSTKGAQEKEKHHNEKKKKITEQGDWHDQTIFSPASTSTYSKENSTASVETEGALHKNALHAILFSLDAISVYLELASLTLIERDRTLLDKLYLVMLEVTFFVGDIFTGIKDTAAVMDDIFGPTIYCTDFMGPYGITFEMFEIEIKQTVARLDNIVQDVQDLETLLELKVPVEQMKDQSKAGYDHLHHLQQLCKDEERSLKELQRDFTESAPLSKEETKQREEAEDADIKEKPQQALIEMLRPGPALLDLKFGQTIKSHYYILVSDHLFERDSNIVEDIKAFLSELTSHLETKLIKDPKLQSKIEQASSVSLEQPSEDELKRSMPLKLHKEKDQEESGPIKVQDESISTSSQLPIKVQESASLQLRGGCITKWCFQRIQVHFECITVQLKRIKLSCSRLYESLKFIEHEKKNTIRKSLDRPTLTKEWSQVRQLARDCENSNDMMKHSFRLPRRRLDYEGVEWLRYILKELETNI
ncbi:uncharacterized protein LOC132720014 [Ruditapes philippinarum]|uniref:uncharacterized protein LOC132720014 n=1 Tax=Ruditapes philippinarum TaxID=129788 RepID=UPI00295BC890|nr:uncharacterized protein LOC132720014 [Ruditapes philippinarum]